MDIYPKLITSYNKIKHYFNFVLLCKDLNLFEKSQITFFLLLPFISHFLLYIKIAFLK